MSEIYNKDQVEAALFGVGFSILQESDSFTIYHNNMYPGDEIVLEWSRGSYEWNDLQKQLEYHSIDSKPIHEHLISH